MPVPLFIYVIAEPKAPFPWINYLGNDEFFGLVSNTAGGYCFYKDAKFRRLTRYRCNNVPRDVGGRYYCIKDGGRVWNPGWKPTQTDLDSCECRHGLSYSRFIGEKGGAMPNARPPVPIPSTSTLTSSTTFPKTPTNSATSPTIRNTRKS